MRSIWVNARQLQNRFGVQLWRRPPASSRLKEQNVMCSATRSFFADRIETARPSCLPCVRIGDALEKPQAGQACSAFAGVMGGPRKDRDLHHILEPWVVARHWLHVRRQTCASRWWRFQNGTCPSWTFLSCAFFVRFFAGHTDRGYYRRASPLRARCGNCADIRTCRGRDYGNNAAALVRTPWMPPRRTRFAH